jgi:Tfp pilus assembly protein PilF
LLFLAGCVTRKPVTPHTASQRDQVPAGALPYISQLVEAGQVDAAEDAARKVLAADPSSRGARYYLAVIQEAKTHKAQREPRPRFWIQTIPPQPIY